MNNYVLNNTSVYLGGQCGWDIVLSNKDNELYVSEFQLTPLAYNIPFNKKTHSYSVNNNHSDNLKKFYNDIKENFWWTTPNIDKYSKFDATYMRGMTRLPEYSVYNKQFRYLVPLWLENISNKTLKFKFNFYATNSDGSKGFELDSKTIDFQIRGDIFHDKFIKYFNEWLTYLNIIPNPERYRTEEDINEGNDKVINIDLKNRKATIDGIYINTGQRSGEVNVDYITDNLLSIERPNMEVDYLISSLFNTHNIISSQLLNLCFCFNLEDMINPFILNQLRGSRISADCEVYLDDQSLEKRNLFTNYENIKKNTVIPFLIVNNTDFDSINNLIIPNYDIIVKNAGSDDDTYKPLDIYKEDDNVLNYLKDYNDKRLKYINKINQHTHHWGYVGGEDVTFNLYNGYKCSYIDFGESLTYVLNEENKKQFKAESYDVIASNGLSVIEFPDKYSQGNNAFSWLYPGRILYADGSIEDVANLMMYLNSNIPVIINYDEKNENILFSLQRCANFWGYKNQQLPTYKCLCMYVNDVEHDLYERYKTAYSQTNIPWMCQDGGEIVYDYKGGNEYIIISKSNADYYFILTNDLNKLILPEIINIITTAIDSNYNQGSTAEQLEILLDYFKTTKIIISETNEGEYYGFGTDIGIFEDDLLQQTYYKLDNQTAYVYRRSGPITPLYSKNYENFVYFFDKKNNEIVKGGLSDNVLGITEIKYIPETNWLDKMSIGWDFVLSNKIIFEFEKGISNMPLKNRIIELLQKYYNIKYDDLYDIDTVSNYIYNLYNIDIHFEYASETDISEEHIKYTIKMNLK